VSDGSILFGLRVYDVQWEVLDRDFAALCTGKTSLFTARLLDMLYESIVTMADIHAYICISVAISACKPARSPLVSI
jgi:hypothetical protein